jgi:subtilisin family serine protease
MRLLWMMIVTAGFVSSAAAQLRLPSAQLPVLSAQKLTQAATQVGATLDQLSDVRHLQIARLIRANPSTVAADPHGNAIVRDELLAFSPSESAVAAARTRGFAVVREQTIEDLDIHVVVLQPPRNMSMTKALRQLRDADPAGTYDFNHIYSGGGLVSGAASPGNPPPDGNGPDGNGPDGAARPMSRIGLIDSGIDISHPGFHDATIHSWGCGNKTRASSHGTAVASLLVGQGQESGFRGGIQTAELFAADVYCDAPTGGAVDALAAAFAWLVKQRVAVINVSLVGPDNAALAQIVRALTSRGYLLVAAVGNDGPAAPPLYPASYPHVIGVTGVDAHRRVLIEAARGSQVMFAAQGADMLAADTAGKYSAVRGTSFAAPIVAALLAQTLSTPDLSSADAAVQALVLQAIDLGSPGRDLTYGFGLVGAGR